MKPWKTLNVAGLLLLGMTCFALRRPTNPPAPKVGGCGPGF